MDEIFEGLLKGSKIRSIQIAGIFVGANRVRKTGQVFQGVFFKTSKIDGPLAFKKLVDQASFPDTTAAIDDRKLKAVFLIELIQSCKLLISADKH